MCMYVAHWNIFMVNKRDLQQQQKKKLCQKSVMLGTVPLPLTNKNKSRLLKAPVPFNV